MPRRYRTFPRLLALLLIVAGAIAACQSEDDLPPSAVTSTVVIPEGATVVQSEAPGATSPAAGQTEPPSLTQVGHLDLSSEGYTANVRALGNFAYVGSWGGSRCPAHGVRIVDLSDPANPQLAAIAARYPGTSAEDIVPLRVETPWFRGDLLAVGIQRCLSGRGPGGLALWDVTDPRNPTELQFLPTGAVRGVHELDLVVRDGRVLALLAVPDSERSGGGDFWLVDVSDPRNPTRLSTWGVRESLGLSDGVGCDRALLDHSAIAGAGGTLAYLSYWDAGAIVLDISDPAAPRLVSRMVDPTSEGAIHSVADAGNGLLLVTEEYDVFDRPSGLQLRVDSVAGSETISGCEGVSARPLDSTGALAGGVVFAGPLCDAATANLTGAIALTTAGGCSVSTKAARAATAGALALLLPSADTLPATPFIDNAAAVRLPVVAIGADDAARLRDQAGRGGATITLPTARPWGGVQIWDARDPTNPRLRSVFRTENAVRFPTPGGEIYSVHNVVGAGRYALLSWYSDGVRVVDLADPDQPREVAAWTPPATADAQGSFPTAPMVWGVALAGDLVLASDINSGLWVLRSTGLR